MSDFTACTIVSNNYLPFARVLARSFLGHHPAGRFSVLIVDRPDQKIDYAAEPFEVFFVEDLDIPAFRNMAYRYNVLELNTAVKPYFLADLHQRSQYSRICYFDPDILILNDLSGLYRQLGQSDLLLTPHITDPLDDQAHPSERDILNAGIYNLGFLGVSFNPRTLRFLRWWQSRLHRHGINRIEEGLFVDQKWMDFAPAFLPRAEVLRDPGCNVAYWNLAQRRPEQHEGAWLVEGRPLRFFHFSGFSPHDLEGISRHQNRFALSDLPQLRPLFEHYRDRLFEQGYDELRSLPCVYNSFDNGVTVPDCSRHTLHDLDPQGHRWPDPFDTAGPEGFFEWLRTSAYPSIPLPRLALSFWDQDSFCRNTFLLGKSPDLERFARWFATEGAQRCGADDVFVESLRLYLAGPDQPPCGLQADRPGGRGEELFWILSAHNPRAALKSWLKSLGAGGRFWLEEDASLEAARPRISRMALTLHRSRQDLADTFPDPLGSSRKGFAWWFVTSARWEYALPPEAVVPVISSLPLRERLRARLWWLAKNRLQEDNQEAARETARGSGEEQPGKASEVRFPARSAARSGVHLVGYMQAPSGKGQEARAALEALRWNGVPHRAWTVDSGTHGFLDAEQLLAADDRNFGVVLLFVNASRTRAVLSQLPPPLRSVPYRVGYWDWELSHFPIGYAHQFEGLDEIWTSSRFSLKAISALSPLPVRWVPPCVATGQSEPASRSELGVPDQSFLFFNAFDGRSIPERKNPEGLLEAFRILCRRTEHPIHLLIKAQYVADNPQCLQRWKGLAESLPVSWITETLSRERMDALMAACDCYVSLHRSEGLGLPLIEAMYAGKPVVATGYSGCQDFLDHTTGWVVDYRLRPLRQSYGPYPEGAVWADPDPEQAAERMEEVMTSPDRQERLERARQRVIGLYSPRAAGEGLERELHRIGAG
ncbi:MAG: glycosyltransferase, partial [Acidobacteriota bacterium]